MKLGGFWKGTQLGARAFIARADAARDEGRWRDAAALYREALRLDPTRAGVHVQAGHMFKEAGEFDEAEHHYREADRLMPDDADLALQFGHLYKLTGRLNDAVAAYRRAAKLAPDSPDPKGELDRLRMAGLRMPGEDMAPMPPVEDPYTVDPERPPYDPELAMAYGSLAPEQLPRPLSDLLRHSEPSINLSRFGVELNTFWGLKRVARGLEAIRGFCISTETLLDVTVLIGGLPVHRGPLKGPYVLEYEPDPGRIHKYVFNIWSDFARFVPGFYAMELRFRDQAGRTRSLHEDFVVEAPLSEDEHPDSDAIITLSPDDPRPIETQVNTRPSIVHEALRPDRRDRIRTILVMRTDQLGDLVTSIPAIKRLRQLFPQARLVGLLGPANAALAQTLGLFDGIVIADFRESMVQRRRLLALDSQKALRAELAVYDFDIAIDLAQSLMSRPLLGLSGARFLYGFRDPNWPRLTASVDDSYLDPKNHREIATHSTRILAMVERLGALFASGAHVIRRDDLTRDRLEAHGIAADDRFAVLHTGARIVFSRWRHYLALAERLHRDTDLKIVLFTDKPGLRDGLPDDIAASERFVVIDHQMAFDDFDAMMSYCAVYVGNDSGPKHLAALRGVPVVSIHSARIDWNEWGQEQTGVVISRKVPCAGCALYHDVDECGQDFVCMTAIGLDEVYAAVRRYV